jgi:hypothetical protein
MQAALGDELHEIANLPWPPMRHVRRGMARLDEQGRRHVAARLRGTLSKFQPKPGVNRAALRRFFSFLSQVEVIAIEVPLSALPTAWPEVVPLLERQLADEVFHSTVFAALAQRLGGLDEPIAEAERVLDHIRAQEDPRTTAVLLNLIAEGWIENLFDQAVQWGVADEVFGIVLDDESRHVEEAHAHAEGLDSRKVGEAVRAFETELFRLSQHPRVMLPILALAGEARFRALGESFLATHKAALSEVGLEPAPEVREMERILAEMGLDADAAPLPVAREVEPETQWRRTALELWDTPRNPAMSGWCEVRVDHVPKHLLTAVTVAAIGKVLADYPRMNRYVHGGKLWQPATVNVGVRAGLGDKGEALTTLVVTEADRRSVEDIRNVIREGVARMNAMGESIERPRPGEGDEPLRHVLRDEELAGMMPAGSVAAPVTVSNVGKTGLHAGFGAMPGALGQSLEIIVGRVEKKPQWTGWRYKPVDTVVIGCTADHRVIDGTHAGEAMRRLREALSPAGVREILDRPDTLTRDELAKLAKAQGQGAMLLACKAPWWLGWLCYLFKK